MRKIRLRIQQEKNTNIHSSTHKMHFKPPPQPVLIHSYTETRVWNHTQFLTLSTIPHSHSLTKNLQTDTPTQTTHAQDFPVRYGFKRSIGEFFESFQETPHPPFLLTLNCLFAMERDFLPGYYMEYYTENNVIRLNSKFRIFASHYKQSVSEISETMCEKAFKILWQHVILVIAK